MRNLVTRLIITLAFGSLMAVAASALDLDADLNGTNSVVANGLTIDGNGNGTADLTNGDTLAIEIFVSNLPQDDITAIFASLVYDSDKLNFLGGAFTEVLIEASCTGFLCTPARLTGGIPNPIRKPNSPFALMTGTEDWIQALAHANVGGTTGAGGESGVLLAFSVIGNLGTAPLTIGTALTQGDVVGTTGGAEFGGPVTFDDVVINAPEPSALAASMASLGSLALVAYRRRARV